MGRRGAPAAPPSSTATRWTICWKPRPRTLKPAETWIPRLCPWDSLKGDSDQVFSLALDLLFHPNFSAEKLELAQQQAATGIVRRNDDEDEIAGRESAKLVYGANSPYTRQPELATIGAVTVDDLKAWHDRTSAAS